jgi:hypothetical protein
VPELLVLRLLVLCIGQIGEDEICPATWTSPVGLLKHADLPASALQNQSIFWEDPQGIPSQIQAGSWKGLTSSILPKGFPMGTQFLGGPVLSGSSSSALGFFSLLPSQSPLTQTLA